MVECAPRLMVPEELADGWDEQLAEAHGRLAAMSCDEFRGAAPRIYRLGEAGTVSFVSLSPAEDHDEHSAVVIPFPFGAGGRLDMFARAKLLQDSLPEPQRLILFPNNTLQKYAYDFSSEERHAIGQTGDFTPLVERQFRTLDKLGIEYAQVLGYSQGAAVGATMLRLAAKKGYFKLGPSGLMDPPNVTERSRLQLMKDFASEGVGPLCTAVNQAAIPMLTTFQRAYPGKVNLARNNLTSATRTALNAHLLPTNRALKDGFRHARFVPEVDAALEADEDLRLLAVRAGNSRIMPPEAMDDLTNLQQKKEYDDRLRLLTVEGYGHEMAANIVVHALLGRMALSDTETNPTTPAIAA